MEPLSFATDPAVAEVLAAVIARGCRNVDPGATWGAGGSDEKKSLARNKRALNGSHDDIKPRNHLNYYQKHFQVHF